MKKSQMKKSILAAFSLFALIGSSIAQDMSSQPLEKGNFMLGFGMGLSTSTADIEVSGTTVDDIPSTVSTQVNLAPRLGYFFTDNLVVGLGVQALVSKVETDGGADGDYEDARTLFGPYLRYYFPVGDDQAFYLGVVTGFGGSTSDITVNGETQSVDNSITAIGVGPGYSIFAGNRVALETQLLYNFGNSTNNIDVGGINTETTTTTNAFDISVGINYYFSRAK